MTLAVSDSTVRATRVSPAGGRHAPRVGEHSSLDNTAAIKHDFTLQAAVPALPSLSLK